MDTRVPVGLGGRDVVLGTRLDRRPEVCRNALHDVAGFHGRHFRCLCIHLIFRVFDISLLRYDDDAQPEHIKDLLTLPPTLLEVAQLQQLFERADRRLRPRLNLHALCFRKKLWIGHDGFLKMQSRRLEDGIMQRDVCIQPLGRLLVGSGKQELKRRILQRQ